MITQVALGIVLGAILLALLPAILRLSFWILCGGAILGAGVVLIMGWTALYDQVQLEFGDWGVLVLFALTWAAIWWARRKWAKWREPEKKPRRELTPDEISKRDFDAELEAYCERNEGGRW